MKSHRYFLHAGLVSCLVLFTAVLASRGSAETTRGEQVVEVMTYVTAPGREGAFEEARSAMFGFLKKQRGFVSVTSRQDLKDPNVHVDLSV